MSGSSSKQKPEILGTEELKTEAKWLKLERINWKDEEGKEVSSLLDTSRMSLLYEADSVARS